MTFSARHLILCFFAFVSISALAQTEAKKREFRRELPLIVLPPSLVPFSAPVDCDVASPKCPVEIVILEGPINGVQACIANLPSEIKVHGTGAAAPERLMVWTLKPPTGSTATYEFQPKFGILVVDNPQSQLKGEGIGDGSGGTDKMQYHWTNKRKKKVEIVYLPIILQRVGGVVSLCGAADPKVVND
jgi:hypothetical protein